MRSPAGRIASCASCAFLTLRTYVRASAGKYSSPYCSRIVVRPGRADRAGGRVEVAAFGDALAVELGERRRERCVFVGRGEEGALEVVPLPGAEAHPRPLPFDDHADGDTLHAARRRGLAPA